MVDTVLPAVRSRMMSRVKGRNTAPEMAVRCALHAAGYRFRLHRGDLPGRPDIVLPHYGMAVLVHGCFWHGHDCRRGRRPGSNVEFWNLKLARNVERDRVNVRALEAGGWRVTTLWECELQSGISGLLNRLNSERGAPRN